MRLVIRTDAETDLAEGYGWYEQQRSGLGVEFLAEVSRVFKAVQSAPQHYPQVLRLLRRAIVRRFPYGVFFIARTDAVVIVAVMHLARDPLRLKSRQ